MTVYVELELTAYLLGIDYGRYVIISFIEQCQYCLVNIVVDKDNMFVRTFNQVGHESIGIINLTIVEHTLFRLCVALIQSAKYQKSIDVNVLRLDFHKNKQLSPYLVSNSSTIDTNSFGK